MLRHQLTGLLRGLEEGVEAARLPGDAAAGGARAAASSAVPPPSVLRSMSIAAAGSSATGDAVGLLRIRMFAAAAATMSWVCIGGDAGVTAAAGGGCNGAADTDAPGLASSSIAVGPSVPLPFITPSAVYPPAAFPWWLGVATGSPQCCVFVNQLLHC